MQMQAACPKQACLDATTQSVTSRPTSFSPPRTSFPSPLANPTTCPPHSQSALRSILRTVRKLHRLSKHAPSHQPFPHLCQSRTSRNLAPIPPLRILRPTPQHLRRGRRTGPNLLVHVHAVRLLAPHVHLAADDERSQVSWDAGERIESVDLAPVFARGTVVCVGVVCLG